MQNGARFRFFLLTAISAFAATTGATARASWPMARHDAQRIGAADGKANVTTPIAYWRQYLGGAIAGAQLATADVTGSGQQDLLIAAGGRVVATSPSDTVLWQTPPRGIVQFAGMGDLDGDGVIDLVAQSSDHVIILSSRTGAFEWTEPDGEMGTIGSVRVGDVTGDGKADVLVMECGCCGVNSGNTGAYWSFANGFANASRVGAVASTAFACGASLSATLVNADTSAQYETLVANSSQFFLLDGAGNVLANTGVLGTWMSFDECATANIDGLPGDEAVCLLSSNQISVPRQITVLHYDYAAQPPSLQVLWSNQVAPASGGDMRWVDPLVDLDGDGLFELIVSTDDPANGWLTHVYDARSGTDLVTPIPGQIVAGSAALESKTSRLLLTASGANVTAWTFVRSPSPSITARWAEPNVAVLTYPNTAQASVQSIAGDVLATDLNGDGLPDLVVQGQSPSTSTSLFGLSSAGGNLTQLATASLPSGTDLLQAWVLPAVTITKPQIAVARSDGILNLLDGKLQATGTGQPPSEVDVHVGGYYASGSWRELFHAPRVVTFGTGASQSVIVNDSRSALLRLDAASASLAVAPTVTWQLTHTYGPTVAASASGANGAIACLALTEPVSNPPQYRVRVVNPDGSIGWDKALNGVPLDDLAPGNFNGDGVPDFALQLGSASSPDLTTVAFSGSDGSLLWTTMPINPGAGGTQSSGLSIGTFAGAVDDVYLQAGATYVLSGADGSQLATGGPNNTYSMPMLFDTTGSGQDEVILNAGFWPVSLYSHDLTTALWTSTDADHPYPYGAIAQCPGTPGSVVLVEGSLQNPARLKFTTLSGASLGTFTTVVLAGGQLFANEAAAKTAGAFLGQLTSANVHANLTGKNRPSAVVGSSDGWLYGLNPCDRTLDFATQIGAPVGEAVFGDTDGDGNDEVLVTAADGYLYDFKNFVLAAPAYVWDTDPDHGITNHEVSDIVTTNKLSATWAAVSGASSYAVQVVTAKGEQPVSKPLWQNVGNVTSTSLPGLPLQDGTKYLFAVRAIGPNGPSVDAVSSGVTVHFSGGGGTDGGLDASADSGMGRDGSSALDGAAEGGATGNESPSGGGCGCRTAGSAGGTAWPAGFCALPFVAIARKRRRR